MAAAALGRMSGAAREKLLPGPGARGLGVLARSLVLALLLAPVLCFGNGLGVAARDGAGLDRDRAPPTHGGPHRPGSRGRSWAPALEALPVRSPRPEKWDREIPGPEWVGGDVRWPWRGRSLEEDARGKGARGGVGVGGSLECLRVGSSEVFLADWMGDRLE